MNVALLAAADLARFVLFVAVILFIVIPMIGQLVTKIQNTAKQISAPRPQRPRSDVSQEQVEEFLQRASGRAVEGRTQAKPATPAPVAAEVVGEQPVGGRVNRQVRQFMDTSEFGRRETQMGTEVTQSDAQFQQQVTDTFRDEVGTLAKRADDAATVASVDEEADAADPSRPTLDAVDVAGAGLSALFQRPENVVNAFILSEILTRREIDADFFKGAGTS